MGSMNLFKSEETSVFSLLLDTNIIIGFCMGKRDHVRFVNEANKLGHRLLTSPVVIYEALWNAGPSEGASIKNFINDLNLVNVTEEVSQISIATAQRLLVLNQRIETADNMILGTAIVSKSVLVTSDRKLYNKAGQVSVPAFNPEVENYNDWLAKTFGI